MTIDQYLHGTLAVLVSTTKAQVPSMQHKILRIDCYKTFQIYYSMEFSADCLMLTDK